MNSINNLNDLMHQSIIDTDGLRIDISSIDTSSCKDLICTLVGHERNNDDVSHDIALLSQQLCDQGIDLKQRHNLRANIAKQYNLNDYEIGRVEHILGNTRQARLFYNRGLRSMINTENIKIKIAYNLGKLDTNTSLSASYSSVMSTFLDEETRLIGGKLYQSADDTYHPVGIMKCFGGSNRHFGEVGKKMNKEDARQFLIDQGCPSDTITTIPYTWQRKIINLLGLSI